MKDISLDELVEKIKKHPDFSKVGMIAFHLGIVRGLARRNGRPVERLEVEVDHQMVKQIIEEKKKAPGIVEILISVREGVFKVGEPLMALAVAGDIREHVFPVLEETVDLIKTKAVKKKEEKQRNSFEEGRNEQ